jgi:hypothetical protein
MFGGVAGNCPIFQDAIISGYRLMPEFIARWRMD